MQYQETAKLLSVIQCFYRNQVKEMDPELNALTIDIWHSLLEEVSFGEAKRALMFWMDNNKFAPQVCDIKELVAKMRNPEAFKSAEIAWEEVSRAASQFGFHKQSEAYKTFCDKIKRVLKTVKWWDICYSDRPEIVKSNFIKAWNNITASEKESGALPLHRALHILPKYGQLQEEIKQSRKSNDLS